MLQSPCKRIKSLITIIHENTKRLIPQKTYYFSDTQALPIYQSLVL